MPPHSPLTNNVEVWRDREVSPFSINFDGVYVKIAFFGSKCLHLRRKMNSCRSGCRPETRESFRQPKTFFPRIDKPQFVNALMRQHPERCRRIFSYARDPMGSQGLSRIGSCSNMLFCSLLRYLRFTTI